MSPEALRAFHGWCTAFWLPFTVVAYFVGWLQSVIFVSIVSMLALFLGSFSSWQASRTEVRQEEIEESRSRDKINPCLRSAERPHRLAGSYARPHL